jgi:hypothetical protein
MSGDEVETAGYDAATREENVKFCTNLTAKT